MFRLSHHLVKMPSHLVVQAAFACPLSPASGLPSQSEKVLIRQNFIESLHGRLSHDSGGFRDAGGGTETTEGRVLHVVVGDAGGDVAELAEVLLGVGSALQPDLLNRYVDEVSCGTECEWACRMFMAVIHFLLTP